MHASYISKLLSYWILLISKKIHYLQLACKDCEQRIELVIMLGLFNNARMRTPGNFGRKNRLHQSFRLKRWINCSTVHHRYQYSSIENKIYQIYNSNIIFNPDFGNINQIHSHRAEIYGALSVFLFLHEYCNFYKIQLQSPIE